MHSIDHMHRASAPGSGRLDLSLAGRRASRRTRSQRVAVVVAQVAPALLRSSSMEVLERPSAQDPAKSGHECRNRGTATMSRSSAHTHTRRWHALRACGGDNQTNQGSTPRGRSPALGVRPRTSRAIHFCHSRAIGRSCTAARSLAAARSAPASLAHVSTDLCGTARGGHVI